MKTYLRLISLFLVLIMLVSCFAACTGTEEEKETTLDSESVTSKAEVEEGLPNKDLNGELYTVLGRDAASWTHLDNFEIAYDELPEEVVGQAVYNRNQALKNKYNFIVTQILVENASEAAKISYESGDDLYDLVLYQPQHVQAHAQEGYLLDLNEVPYVDLEHDSWSQYINEQLTIGDKLYYTSNDFLLLDKSRAFFLFYNRDLAADLKLGYLEDMVDNDTWTLENATKLAKQVYRDVDNNGPSNADYYGFTMQGSGQFIYMAVSAGFRFTEKDNTGFPKLVGATDKMLNIIDATLDFTADKTVSWCPQSMKLTSDGDNHPEIIFLDERALLLSMTAAFIEYSYKLHGGTFDFGILPNPKYDTTQEDYCSYPDISLGSVLAVPYTVFDEEMAGFCLEAITEASTDTSYITYIDTKSKYQDAPDEDCARMMDLCFENQVYDIGAFLFNGSKELYTRTSNELQNQNINLYKRLFDACKSSAQSKIDELILSYGK